MIWVTCPKCGPIDPTNTYEDHFGTTRCLTCGSGFARRTWCDGTDSGCRISTSTSGNGGPYAHQELCSRHGPYYRAPNKSAVR